MNTLLIVDDELRIRQEMKTMVQQSGVFVSNIIECNNGQAALEILETQLVDVMFTDIRMPGMDGIELIEAMQKLEDKPFTVVISGHDDFAGVVKCLRMGVREYVLKPAGREQITEILQKLDEELQQTAEYRRQIKAIGCQLLKYMIVYEHMAEKETGAIQKQFEKWLVDKEYVLCCLECGRDELEESINYLSLGELEGNQVCVVGKENKDFLLKNELWDAYVGCSKAHTGVADVKVAYFEAKTARKAAFVWGQHEVEYSEELLSENDGNADEEKMHKIAQMIGNNKISEALKAVELFFEEIKRKKDSLHVLEIGIHTLVNDILNIYQNVLQGEEKQLQKIDGIYQFPQINDLMEELTGWMIDFHEKVDEKFYDYKNKTKMQQALTYILDNYDKDLNMAVVSNYVSMNYSLFSYAFKQYTGKNFVSYLKELRVNEAKRLLAETDMRVIEVSRRTGYENEKHFMKTFKSMTGVSPTEYRKNMQFGGNRLS